MRILQNVVTGHLNLKAQKVFGSMDAVEASLRKRCLKDRLCRLAEDKYHDHVMADDRSWLDYLKGSRGKAHIEKWVDRKIQDVVSKWTTIGR